MSSRLVEVERKAIELQSQGQFGRAAELFADIVKECPNWEHGSAFYSLANCYEDLGQRVLAEQHYRDALCLDPANPIFLGGLASFLFLHGDPEKAFAVHMKLLEVHKTNQDQVGIDSATTALRALGKRMRLSDEAIVARISDPSTPRLF